MAHTMHWLTRVRFERPRLRASFSTDERGAALVEFSLVAAMLFALCFGIIQYGLIFFVWNNMYDAARQGARSLAVGTWDEAEAEAGATAMLASWPTGWVVNATDGAEQVTMVITVPGDSAGIVGFLPTPETLSATVIMRKE